MSAFNAPREQLLASLRRYTSALEGRKAALTRLSDTSDQLRTLLRDDPTADIRRLMDRRQHNCHELAALLSVEPPGSLGTPVGLDRGTQDDEVGRLTRSAIALRDDVQALANRILACQAECEAAVKSRIEEISDSIQESKQRRKLNAAYGPARFSEVPTFLDRQR